MRAKKRVALFSRIDAFEAQLTALRVSIDVNNEQQCVPSCH